MKEEKCIPLILTNKMGEKYPMAWTEAEDLRKINGKNVKWDKRCYLPIAAAIAIASSGDDTKILNDVLDADLLAAIVPWRLHKQIFTFDEELERILLDQADEELRIPIEILNNLPYTCIYIKLHDLEYDGFFVHFESDVNDGTFELRFLLCKKDVDMPPFPLPLHLKSGYTLQDSVNEVVKKAADNAANLKSMSLNGMNNYHKELIKKSAALLQLVLYICAENKEVEEDVEQKRIYKKPQNSQYIKDKYREVQKFNCGKEIGNLVRKVFSEKKTKLEPQNTEDIPKNVRVYKKGTMKSPHSRRGHWHHFWTGKRDSSERKLILKWLPPTFVNLEFSINEQIVTTNKISK